MQACRPLYDSFFKARSILISPNILLSICVAIVLSCASTSVCSELVVSSDGGQAKAYI